MSREASSSRVRRADSAWRPPRICTDSDGVSSAAMRSPDAGLERLRAATGAAADDPRLLGVRLDLEDSASIAAAAKAIEESIGAPDVLVHNAGIAAVGSVEDTAQQGLAADVLDQSLRAGRAHQGAAALACGPRDAVGSSSCRARAGPAACRRSAPTPPRRALSRDGPKPWRRRSPRSASASPSW